MATKITRWIWEFAIRIGNTLTDDRRLYQGDEEQGKLNDAMQREIMAESIAQFDKESDVDQIKEELQPGGRFSVTMGNGANIVGYFS